jgi:hypothetical protein
MSVGPLGGLAASISGTPLSQAKGTEPERVGQEAVAAQRRRRSDELAETAAGIGAPDGEDHQSAGRSGSGRPGWEYPSEGTPSPAADSAEAIHPNPVDVSGQSGRLLDLSG